jgi:glycerophosphoryl diester phosphodiesterase
MKEKLIIAHRGDTSCAAENTIPAFQKAAENGADMIELDVRWTRDEVAVVHHSPNILGRPIHKMSWSEIHSINQKRKIEVPKLEEVLKIMRGKIKIDIEIKEFGHEKETAEMALKYFSPEDFFVSSFDDISIADSKKYFPKIKAGLLLSFHKPGKIFSAKREKLFSEKRYRSSPADFFLPHVSLVKIGFLKKLEKFRKPLIAWTVDDRRTLKNMIQNERLAGVITNKLETALSLRQKTE